MVISENCCNFKVLKIKSLQTIIAMITEDKVTEIFCNYIMWFNHNRRKKCIFVGKLYKKQDPIA